ncbi:MAG: Uma2 family endonuclease [Myxococcaceae bacterium]|nr:Uma2 family endonuclease [Myxococcaceae bacterium]MCI0672902.1 Uma2 family endonuclease [Myxococcaceae bacterium]
MKPERKKPATYADIVALPANMVGQLIGGELIAHPRPASPHALASSVLGAELMGPFHRARGGPGGWWIVFEPELHFDEDVLVPDLAGWRQSRLPSFPSAPFLTLAPDWVCEVLSPSTSRVDRVDKKHIYAREGVEFVWLLDPLAKTLEVFQLRAGQWVELGAFSEDARVRAAPFDAIELELGALWIPEAPAP